MAALKAGKHVLSQKPFVTDLDLWSPSSPKLYEVEIAAETDTVADTIGFEQLMTFHTRSIVWLPISPIWPMPKSQYMFHFRQPPM